MRVTAKGQVTIPQNIREKLGITAATEVDFVEEDDRIFLVKRKGEKQRFENLQNYEALQLSK